ncbi:MAG: Na+/proline symporter [Halieaceae bacterium]|jgi:Na+/proline symporter
MSLYSYAWLFMVLYIGAMLGLGYIASRRVKGADDFATARNSYGPLLLSLAFASTAASGATFLGMPGLTYTYGVSVLWIAFLYPIGIYIGVMICQHSIGRFGNAAGARSIPEYLGERYQSEALRISAAVLSLLLLFYLAGQLIAGLVMFEMMLGLSQEWALAITAVVLIGYVTMGGAHADILTDGAQGALMVLLALAITVFFLKGFGVGGLDSMLDNLRQQDSFLMTGFNPSTAITASSWSYISLVIAHIPLGLLPHIGNKLWALEDEKSRVRFLVLAFVFGMIMPTISLGGLVARALFEDSLLAGGANAALPAVFIELFPAWLAALLGVGVLAAIMSTADGLLISTSQVFANDIYRRSIAPRFHSHLTDQELDSRVLRISRALTVLTLIGAIILGWSVMHMNIALLVWAGVGGFTAALMGPLVLGSLWVGISKAGALAGFWGGAITFVLIHGQIIDGLWLTGTVLASAGEWFAFYAQSPYSAAAMGGLVSVALCIVVSKFTSPLPAEHLAQVVNRVC